MDMCMSMGMCMREYGYWFVKELCRPAEVGCKSWEQLGGSMGIESNLEVMGNTF